MTNTSERAYRYRRSDHLAGLRPQIHGRLQTAEKKPGLLKRLFGREIGCG